MIDKKYLEGLTWKSSKAVTKSPKGIVYEPIKRNLEVSDVLSMKDYGSFYNIVTSDGRKYKIQKIIKKEGANV